MNDRKEKIMKRVQEHYDYLQNNKYEVVCLCLQGSQNYELDEYSEEYQSDIDTKAIVLPSFEDFCAGKAPISTTLILENNEHIDVKDIRVMFDVINKMNISYIELLYTDYKIVNEKYADLISSLFEQRDLIANANRNQFVRCIAGMSMEKKKALCHPYPNLLEKIEKYGYDGKQLSHCVRLFEFLERYMNGEPLKDCYVSHLPDSLKNYKKQLTKEGDRILLMEEAIEICEQYDNATKSLKDYFIANNPEGSDPEASKLLSRITKEILKRRFQSEFEEDFSVESVRKRSQSNHLKDTEAEWAYILAAINLACADGDTATFIEREIYNENKEKLKKLGYTVVSSFNDSSLYNYSTYISWKGDFVYHES